MAYTQKTNPFKKTSCGRRYGPLNNTNNDTSLKSSPLNCWSGYERVPGTKEFSKGSCKKSSPAKSKTDAAKRLLKVVPDQKAYDKLSDIDKKGFDKAARKAKLPMKKSPVKSNEPRKTTKGKGRNFRTVEEGAGMTSKGVAAYKAKNPGSKLQTAVTGKVKPGSKAAGRRKSFCARSKGWTGERGKAARARWKC